MVFAPFFFIYLLICLGFVIGLLLLLQMQLISSAFLILGLSPRLAILALLLSLIGSYVNIPLYTVESGPAPDSATADISAWHIRFPLNMEFHEPLSR